MDDFALKHMKNLYGVDPDTLPFAFQFPKLPPGIAGPTQGGNNSSMQKKSLKETTPLNTKLQDFQLMYQKYASGLLEMNFPGIIPPGHPLFSRRNSISNLKIENEKLLRENLELKKQLEKLSKNKSQYN